MTEKAGPVAAIDCGTNTVRLLVLDAEGHPVLRESRTVRLGQDVDRTGRLAPEALARTFAAVEEYAGLIAAHGASGRVRFGATSATRDAANAVELLDGVQARLGVRPEVLTGAQEAELTFTGALGGLGAEAGSAGEPVVVVDLGGGSTEVVLGRGGTLVGASLDVGAVRLHERHVRHDPMAPHEIAAIRADVSAALDTLPFDPATAATVIGVSGTILTVAATALERHRLLDVDGAVLPRPALQSAIGRLVGLTTAQRAALPWVNPGRADVLGAGAVIWGCVLERFEVQSVRASVADILDGLAASLR